MLCARHWGRGPSGPPKGRPVLRAVSLEEQIKQNQSALETLDTELAAAKQEVDRLENVRAAMLDEVAEAVNNAEQARGKLSSLATELMKRRENTTVKINFSVIVEQWMVFLVHELIWFWYHCNHFII